MAQVEGVLLLSREPQGSRKIAQLAGLADGTKARTLVRALNRLYDAEGCSFRVEEIAGGFQLMTRPKFAPWIRRLQSTSVEVRLSAPAMETLAVVAYRQPVLRADVEAVRGVQCGEILRQLIERDLVRTAGRSEELGRPFLYATTRQFLQVFGLRSLEELPRVEALRAEPQQSDETSDITVRDSEDPHHEAEEENNVRTATVIEEMPQELTSEDPTTLISSEQDQGLGDGLSDDQGNLDEEEEEEDDFDDDFDEDYEEEYEEEYEDEEDEDEEEDEDLDEEFEDEPWEEVEDDDEEEEEEDEEEEDEEEWEYEDDEEGDDDEEWEEEEDDEEDDEEWEYEDDDEEEGDDEEEEE